MNSMMEHLTRERMRDNIIRAGLDIFKMELTEDEIKHVEDQFVNIFSDMNEMSDVSGTIGYLLDIVLSVMTYNSILVSKLEGTREKD